MSDSPTTPETPEPEAVESEALEPESRDAGNPEPDVSESDAPPVGASAARAPRAPRAPGRARRAALLGLRVVAGAVASGAAVVTVLVVGLAPLPSIGVTPLAVTVTPQPADQVRVCSGSLVRFGDASGGDADTPRRVGSPDLAVTPVDGSVALTRLEAGDAGGGEGAPTVLTLPAGSSVPPAGVQTQIVLDPGLTGLAMTACSEPSSTNWLVGGSTTTGRTTLLLLANPGDVDAQVSLDIWGESGAVAAAGARGIVVAAGTQRVLSLAGFAPDLTAPVVRVTSRGGSVAAALQTSVVRGITDGGVDVVGPSAAPGLDLVVPGVRILGSGAVANALAREGWDDAAAIVRLAVPGADPAKVRVTLVPDDPSVGSSFFELDVDAGATAEAPLDSGVETESGAAIPDGSYTVLIESDQPVVGGVRATAALEPPAGAEDEFGGPAAPASDLAWFPAAVPLGGDVETPTGTASGTLLALANPGEQPVTVTVRVDPGSTDGAGSVATSASSTASTGAGSTATTSQPGAGTTSPGAAGTNSGAASADAVVVAATGETRVDVPARGGVAVVVPAGAVVHVVGAEGLAVGLSAGSLGDGTARLAALALAPPRPLSAPVVVHP
ncbi:MAG: hypothetical protein J0G30_05915 [Actinomycetales bacterium]|nr:hypothetical protein [Actinomycetales bacterium]